MQPVSDVVAIVAICKSKRLPISHQYEVYNGFHVFVFPGGCGNEFDPHDLLKFFSVQGCMFLNFCRGCLSVLSTTLTMKILWLNSSWFVEIVGGALFAEVTSVPTC